MLSSSPSYKKPPDFQLNQGNDVSDKFELVLGQNILDTRSTGLPWGTVLRLFVTSFSPGQELAGDLPAAPD